MEENLELLNILCSCKDMKLLCEVIEDLKNEKVLNNHELELCNDCIKDIETYGNTNPKRKVSDSSMIKEYKESEFDAKVEEFIKDRIYQEFGDIFSVPAPRKIFSKENVDLFLKGYVERIDSKINTSVFNDEGIFYRKTNEIDISTACEKIDEFSLGLRRGNITTIIGDDGYFKSLWALNTAYHAISQGKNVMYLTIGVDKETIVKRLLTRHSNNEKFERPLSYEDMHNINNSNLCERIILDFQENYSYRILIFDEDDLSVPSVRSLRRLIADAQRHFIEENDSGIDLIIIDDLSYLPFYNGKTTTNNRNVVISEYYKFLKRVSKDMLGTGRTCSVLCTHKDKDNGITAAKNEGNYNLGMIAEPIVFWSDVILTIHGSAKRIEKSSRLKVIKSSCGDLMDNVVSVKVSYPTWYLSYDNVTNEEKRVLLNFMNDEINDLKSNNEKLRNEIFDKDKYIEEIKRMGIEKYTKDMVDLNDGVLIPTTGFFSEEEIEEMHSTFKSNSIQTNE